MPIIVREADLQAERNLLIAVLFRWLTPQSDDRRFDWLYRNNPFGTARAWLAIDEDNQSCAGAAAAFPRMLSVQGAQVPGCVFGDFCVAPQQRSLGLALQLQRACFAILETGWAEVAYDFPSASMMAIYKRLSRASSRRFTRMAKPLRADRKIRKILKLQGPSAVASAAANSVLALRDRASARKTQWEISLQEENCGEEFTILAQEVSADYSVCIARTASYLNWRYLSHPLFRHEILTARRGGRLEGYAVFCPDGEDARIVDLFGIENEEMFAALISTVAQIERDRGKITLSAPVLASHSRAAQLEKSGFRARESSDVVVQAGQNISVTAASTASANWFLMDGDRDS